MRRSTPPPQPPPHHPTPGPLMRPTSTSGGFLGSPEGSHTQEVSLPRPSTRLASGRNPQSKHASKQSALSLGPFHVSRSVPNSSPFRADHGSESCLCKSVSVCYVVILRVSTKPAYRVVFNVDGFKNSDCLRTYFDSARIPFLASEL